MKKINGLTVTEYCCCGCGNEKEVWERQLAIWNLGFDDDDFLWCNVCFFYPWFIEPYQVNNMLEEKEALKWMNS